MTYNFVVEGKKLGVRILVQGNTVFWRLIGKLTVINKKVKRKLLTEIRKLLPELSGLTRRQIVFEQL